MEYPKKFDSSDLTQNQFLILTNFIQKRKIFDEYLSQNNIPLFTCLGCGYPTLTERGGYEICCICNWEDDDQDDFDADAIRGGPNYELSLTENRLYIGEKLQKYIQQSGGEIIAEPLVVLNILAQHEVTILNIVKDLPEDADTNHPIVKQWEEAGKELLRRLNR
jgi:hypothetical protein